MTGDRADVQRAVNHVLAAALAWRDNHALGKQTGGEPGQFVEWMRESDDAEARLIDALAGYEATRSETDAARDSFLTRYPTAEALQSAVDALVTEGARHGIGGASAEALRRPERPKRAWLSATGALCCPAHIDWCPPGDSHDRAWHRLRVADAGGVEDPEAKCLRHTGVASNRCGLIWGHEGDCDDLGG